MFFPQASEQDCYCGEKGMHTPWIHHVSVPSIIRGSRTLRSFMVQYMWYVYFGNSKNNSQYNKNNLHLKYIIFYVGSTLTIIIIISLFTRIISRYMSVFLACILKNYQDYGVRILCNNFKINDKLYRLIKLWFTNTYYNLSTLLKRKKFFVRALLGCTAYLSTAQYIHWQCQLWSRFLRSSCFLLLLLL